MEIRSEKLFGTPLPLLSVLTPLINTELTSVFFLLLCEFELEYAHIPPLWVSYQWNSATKKAPSAWLNNGRNKGEGI